MSTSRQAPGRFSVLRDLLAFTLPWVVIFKQAGIGFSPPHEVSEPLLLLMGAVLGVPGIAQIWSLRPGGTGGSAPSPALPDSPSSPITSGADH